MGSEDNGSFKVTKNIYDNYYLANPFKTAILNGEVSIKALDDKARRILRLIFRTTMSKDRPWGSFATMEHSKSAKIIAEEGIVLLKNTGGTLPLNLKELKNIAVIGENATRSMTIGGGSSGLKVKYEISPLQGLKKQLGNDVNITHTLGYASGESNYEKVIQSVYDADSLLREAVNRAKVADVVIFIGGLNKNHLQDCEGADRKDYNLPFGQDKLLSEILKVNKKVIVVMVSGNAYAMPWANEVPAILQSWYLGSEAGNAIASVITGLVNPSGKLPFTFPIKLSDNGAYSFGNESYPGIDKKQEYKEDILVGYRWHDTKRITPLFPFGHGLSYTSFEYGKAFTDKAIYSENDIVKLTFTLKNSGKVKGAEVTQIYISNVKSSVLRPLKELKSFSKVELESGESKIIEIDLPVKEWAFFDDKTQKWQVESGKFIIMIGSSSGDIRQKIVVSVD